MKKRGFLTRTIQPRSRALLTGTGKGLTVNKPETESNIDLVFLVLNSLNELYEALNRLNNALDNIEKL
jgi:hypothetical protein